MAESNDAPQLPSWNLLDIRLGQLSDGKWIVVWRPCGEPEQTRIMDELDVPLLRAWAQQDLESREVAEKEAEYWRSRRHTSHSLVVSQTEKTAEEMGL